MTTPTLPKAAEPARLTEVLRRAGVLNGARVADVEVASSRPTILSTIVRLRLTYDGVASGAPCSLILKTAHPDWDNARWQAGRQEVSFYRDVASALPPGLVPQCFEASWDEASGAWHLLLEDLTDSHVIATQWPLPPTLPQCESIVVALARFHAAWWADPRLGLAVGAWRDKQFVEQLLKDLSQEIDRFAEDLGDRLSADRRGFYTQFLQVAPRLAERRLFSRCHKTVVHGDAHVWNFFLPNSGVIDGVRMFDWDGWRLGTASDDLAYMMALHWHPELRRVREAQLLDRYHDELLRQGVRNYDREALQDDYRLSALWASAIPIWQRAANIPPVVWWHHLDRIHLAMDDLGCRDLL